jgi:hypothetical protein
LEQLLLQSTDLMPRFSEAVDQCELLLLVPLAFTGDQVIELHDQEFLAFELYLQTS